MNIEIDFEKILQQFTDWMINSGIAILVILIGGLILNKIAKILLGRVFSQLKRNREESESLKRLNTLQSVIRYAITIVLLAVIVMMVLGEAGIDIGPILAAAGVLGLAIGFGAQTLVSDVITGFFILMEDQIREGDVVQIAGKGGLVEKVNLRMTILRDLSGNVHYVRNSEIKLVTNMTKDFSYYLFDVGVAYRENTDEVIEVLKQISEQMQSDDEYKDDILDPIEILGVDQFADSAVIIKARIKTRPIKQWRIGRAFNAIMKKKFDELDIEIPFPHMTVYMGQDKDGGAPPANLRLLDKNQKAS
ncbi:MAG: mechanosensitive ion channel [candidate division Zixibacteria bacterium]|nr:mechanosensitive ion channel [candidate division Zixibacteria bacterium]